MVRVKAKKQKGDDAFTKRKQKVGRKKLAPATATRAEIHARTLRLNSSSVLSRASEALQNEGKATQAHARQLEKHKPNAHESKMVAMTTIMHTFSELMANTHHYKASQRASAFVSLQRLLQEQAMINTNKMTASEAARIAVTNKTLLTEQHVKYGSASVSGNTQNNKSNIITPLEQLRGFASALEALTDTEAEVRTAALRAIDTFLEYEWQSSRHATCIMEEEEHNNNETNETFSISQQNNFHEHQKNYKVVDSVVLEQVVAIVQMAYISLTHALRGVRMSAIHLLNILIKHVPSTLLIREAFFRVYAQQQIHTTASVNSTTAFPLTYQINQNYYNTNSSNIHTTKSENNDTNIANSTCTQMEHSRNYMNNKLTHTHNNNNNSFNDKNCNSDDVNSVLNSLEDAEIKRDKWICSLLSRVSALVLKSEYVHLLLSLLRIFFSSTSFHTHYKNQNEQNDSEKSLEWMFCDREEEESVGFNGALRHPEVVAELLLQDVLPKWTNAWKEVMELQASLLRQHDKLEQAICLAECFAVILTYLKEYEVHSRQLRSNHMLPHNKHHVIAHMHDINITRTKQTKSFTYFNKTQLEFFQHVLLIKVPITMKELLERRKDNEIDSNLRARFAMALANICVPLANTEEGWKLLQQYFAATLSTVKNESGSNNITSDNNQKHFVSKENCQVLVSVSRNKSQHSLTTTLINCIDICLRLVYLYKLTNNTLFTVNTNKAKMSSTTSSSTPLHHAEIIYKINNKVVQLLPSLIDAVMCVIDAEAKSLSQVEHLHYNSNTSATMSNNNYSELHVLFKSLTMLLTYCTTLPVHFYLESTSSGVTRKDKTSKEENCNDKKQKCTKAGVSLLYTLSQIPRLLFGLGQLASSSSSSLSSSLQQQSRINIENQKKHNNIDNNLNSRQEEVQWNNYDKNNNNTINISKVTFENSNNNGGNRNVIKSDMQNHESYIINHIHYVDDVVFPLLELLWSLVSSGHCLMFAEYTQMLHSLHNNRQERKVISTNNNGSNTSSNEDNSTKTGESLFTLLQHSVPSLFGMALDNSVMTGVLVWCNERTVSLARHLLFYLHNSNCDRVVLQNNNYNSNNNNSDYIVNTQNGTKQNTETSIANMALLLETILAPEDESVQLF